LSLPLSLFQSSFAILSGTVWVCIVVDARDSEPQQVRRHVRAFARSEMSKNCRPPVLPGTSEGVEAAAKNKFGIHAQGAAGILTHAERTRSWGCIITYRRSFFWWRIWENPDRKFLEDGPRICRLPPCDSLTCSPSQMAVADHLLRYRQKTEAELLAEITRLEALDNGFLTMGMGTKQFALATAQNNDKLNAIAFVRRERGYTVPDGPRATPNVQVGVVDFSNQ
jgi:hypothetical protein